MFPSADLFSVIDFFPKETRAHIGNKHATTTFIQKLPLAKKFYHYYLPFMPFAIEQLDLRGYDLIISSHYAVAKAVITSPDQLHICYCHSPLRSAWDMERRYMEENSITGLKKAFLKIFLHKFRLWDACSASRVDHFLANSHFVAKRIQKAYGRAATVLYSGIEIENFPYFEHKEDFYLTASRLVSYKRTDLIVEAFNRLKKPLIVIGEGPEFHKIAKKCGPTIKMLGYQDSSSLTHYMQRAKGFVFAAEEDFGLVPLEAQACGTPVIAYGKGGALETVDASSGCFFFEQTAASILEAIEFFEKNLKNFSPRHCRENAEKFSDTLFRERFLHFVHTNLHLAGRDSARRSIASLLKQEVSSLPHR